MSQHPAMLAYSALPDHGDPRRRTDRPDAPSFPAGADGSGWTLRRARPDDEPRIRALVRAERLNPTNLRFPTFLVASIGDMVVGAAQIRLHRDGSREFGSLVVAPPFRGRGIGSALIDSLLAGESCRLYVIAGRSWVQTYERHGFRPVPARHAPRLVRRNLRMGQFVGQCNLLRGRTSLGLCVLARPEQSAFGPLSLV